MGRLDSECLRPSGDIASQRLSLAGALGKEVVLAHDEQGKIPLARHVHGFIEGALTKRAITNEAGCDGAGHPRGLSEY